ncbi:hypothetical protein LWI29_008013 [Acer saccharum]|uniref:Uncharacterized protein n=1 Tax=Acer saccharum TaxID=4024 RepID=A0AA39SYC9_ACESA|nr:hypothetical protein LWI29_008013 [Acer saccharum]KAK1581480.1 hypothetical protein Q3G72_006350 [Acer saccharum]
MGKSSSSIKKKRSRVSSLARTRKGSKSKTRRSNKFKKLRRRDDSVSYSSDSDDSRSLVSVSSSSSEDGSRSKRSRSRMRKDVKIKRKRARRRSSSRESAEESRPVKKRKGSKKTDDLQVGKKTDKRKKKKKTSKQKKKKSKREMSVSSASRSCSTCHGGSGSSGESEVEKNRNRFDRKESKDRSRLEEVKSGSKRRSRSRSRSAYSRRSESSGYRSEEELTGEVKPWRLKSVITVLREGREDGGMYEDKHKEEIVYDYDDCPPCRSNDSNDGVSKRDLVNSNSHVASETKRYAEDEKREEPLISNMRTGNVSESDKESEGQYDRSSPGRYGIGMNNAVEETNNEDSGGVDSPRSYDLETVLRQKALENLRSFRKVTQVDAKAPPDNQKDTNECDAKTPMATEAELYQHKSPKGADPIGGSLAEKNTAPAVKKGSTFANEKISGVNDDNKGSLSTKDDAVHPPDQAALASNPNENVSVTVKSVPSKPRWVSLSSRKESSNTYTNKKHVVELQDPPQAKSVTSNSVVETARTTISLPGNSIGEKANDASASDDLSTCPKSISGGVNSNKPQDEATEDSQFQQKTMTVMRGGELVEVSYKVYIPKKAPALARRTFKR